MRKERVGFAVCGSFCTHAKVLEALGELVKEYETVIPIASEEAAFTDTRFGSADDLLEKLEELTGNEVLYDIPSVEPIGPKKLLDVLVIAPATGNTVAKLAAGITDTAVTMAAKAHLRNGGPVVIALASNDGLSAGAKNIGELLVRKNYYCRTSCKKCFENAGSRQKTRLPSNSRDKTLFITDWKKSKANRRVAGSTCLMGCSPSFH